MDGRFLAQLYVALTSKNHTTLRNLYADKSYSVTVHGYNNRWNFEIY